MVTTGHITANLDETDRQIVQPHSTLRRSSLCPKLCQNCQGHVHVCGGAVKLPDLHPDDHLPGDPGLGQIDPSVVIDCCHKRDLGGIVTMPQLECEE